MIRFLVSDAYLTDNLNRFRHKIWVCIMNVFFQLINYYFIVHSIINFCYNIKFFIFYKTRVIKLNKKKLNQNGT